MTFGGRTNSKWRIEAATITLSPINRHATTERNGIFKRVVTLARVNRSYSTCSDKDAYERVKLELQARRFATIAGGLVNMRPFERVESAMGGWEKA